MQVPDIINGCFESIGGILGWHNVLTLYRHKQVRGISLQSVSFFTAWGWWNIYFYSHLNQWVSWCGGLVLASANLVWFSQMIYYTLKEKRDGIKGSN